MPNVIDFSTLPAPAVVESLDYERILAAMRADLVARAPEFSALVESDPAIKILEVCAYREFLLRARVNDAAKAVLLAHSTGADLDNLAALYSVSRAVLVPAKEDAVPPVPAVMEDDGALRRRVLLALDGLSTAGAKNAYIFHALSVPGVRDAAVVAPPENGVPAGRVNVFVLSSAVDGFAPPPLVSTVSQALNAETVRPLTDIVTVASGAVNDYTVTARIVTYPGPDAPTVLANARAGIERYTVENFRLGRDITLSGLYAALHVAGVQRVELLAPTATIVNAPSQCSRCTAINLTLNGTDE